MIFIVLALFCACISCSCAAIPLPSGCGNSFIQTANSIKPYLDSAGQNGVNKLDEGIKQLRNFIVNGDIDGLSSNFQNIGALGMKKLSVSTSNVCLKQAFVELEKIDENVAARLQDIRNPVAAGHLVCNSLSSKAQLLLKCIKK